MEKTGRPFGMRDKLGYGLGDFGCNMSFAFINNYMLLFFVTCMHIDPRHYAVIIVISKILDAINDVIVGRLCDKSKTRRDGKFIPWIKWGSIPLLLTGVLLFIPIPNAAYWFKIAYCFVFYFLWGLAYTCVNVPYGALQSVVTKDADQRASLSTFRSIGAMVAQVIMMILIPLLVYDDEKNPIGGRFVWIVFVMGLVGALAFTALTRLVPERVTDAPQTANVPETSSVLNTLRAFVRNRPMLGLCLATVAQIACLNTMTSYMNYIFMVYFRDTDLISIAVVICGLPMALGVVISKPLLKKFSQKQVCAYPFLISILFMGLITFVPIQNPYLWMVLAGLGMLGTSTFMVLVWAMVADCIDYQEEKTGRREEGSIYAIYSFCRKASQGIGQGISALALLWSGYDETLDVVSQAAAVPDRIRFTTGFIPLIGSAVCFAALLYFYKVMPRKDRTE